MKSGDLAAWAIVIILMVATIYGGIYALSWTNCITNAGQRYDVTVTVQAVERSTRFGDHTNLWVTVYGEQDITYKLIGFHQFELGKRYRIVFVNEAYLCFFVVYWLEVRGRIQTIEQVG